jgi:hypothetical protein
MACSRVHWSTRGVSGGPGNLIRLGLVVQRVDVALLEYALGDEDRVQYAWEARVGGAVKDGLDHLAGGQADVQPGVDVDLELRLRPPSVVSAEMVTSCRCRRPSTGR